MDFNTINYDGDLDSADEDELRSLVGEFEKAQETNVAEFEAAKEQMQELVGDDADFEALFGEVTDFAEAKDELIAETVEFKSFEDSPMGEDDLRGASFSKVREWHAHFAALDAEPDEGADEEQEFEDMGTRGETHVEGDDDEDFARKYLGGMPGFN